MQCLLICIAETKSQHANNVFIHFPPRGPGRIPRAGVESNAFPEIVVGDFGNSGIEGDDLTLLPVSVYPEPDDEEPDSEAFLADWEDIYSTGELLRTMSMAHIPTVRPLDIKPGFKRVRDVNQDPGAPPYSDDLVELLERFEWPNQETKMVRDLGEAVDTTFPSSEELRDSLLPLARERVARFRRPARRPEGYYDDMDVSWTRPALPTPFSYIMEHATEAGDGPDGGPPPEEDDSDGGSGEGPGDDGEGPGDDGGGSGDGGPEVEMSDSPSSPEEDEAGNDEPAGGADGGDHHGDNDGGDDDDNENEEERDDSDENSSPAAPPGPALPPPTSEQLAMRELGKMHKWNTAKPRYELRSLEFGPPTVLPLKTPP